MFFVVKKCRVYAACGVSQTPIKVLSLEVVKDKIRNYGIVVQKAVLLFSVVKLFYFMSIFCLKDSFSITSIVSVF